MAVRRPAAVLAVLATAVGGCSQSGNADTRQLTVLGASSLTDVFTTLAARFETAHPGVEVRVSFAASSTLAQQVIEAAPADVLATADRSTMGQLRAARLTAGGAAVFATNTLVLVTPAENPAGITGVDDLADPEVSVALCAPEVPCGDAARELLRLDDVSVTPVTLEPDVRSVLTKVRLGEVDAGIVYVTDARSAGQDVRAIRTRRAADVVSRYPISVLRAAGQPALARQFVDLVRSAAGRRVLAKAGFGKP